MAEKIEPERLPDPFEEGRLDGIYIDSSALAKLYLPEPESERLDDFLRGRRDLMISELVITEVISAVARRQREKLLNAKQAHEIRRAITSGHVSDSFRRLDLTPVVHRAAERLLLSSEFIPLRTLDALHLALALSAPAAHLITFDARMAEAAISQGLHIIGF